MSLRFRTSVATVLMLCGSSCVLAQQAVDGVVREGEGARRTALNNAERKPFDSGAWSKLSDWKNGPAISASAVAGKPILIVVWSDFLPASKRAVATGKKLAEQHAAKGLVVVCVHNQHEWAAANKPTAATGATFLLAHDASNEFRKAIQSDADPDYYVIDRAGQMRFADIDTGSVEKAVEIAVNESETDAGGLNAKIAAEAKARDLEIRKSEALRTGLDMTNLPEIPFEQPDADTYKDAKWPTAPRDPNSTPEQLLQPEPAQPVNIPEVGWFPKKPEMKGRVTLMYFWHPDARVSYKAYDQFELIQRQMSRDLVVVGVISPLFDMNSTANERLKIETDPDKLNKKLEDFRSSKALTHHILADAAGTLFTMSQKNYPDTQQGIPAPWIAVISSDNQMRWWGWMGSPRARAALDKTLETDPGVKARRAAEDAYIKNRELAPSTPKDPATTPK